MKYKILFSILFASSLLVKAQIKTNEVKVEETGNLTTIEGLRIPGKYNIGQNPNGTAIEIEIPSNAFNAIRGYNGTQYLGEIHFFDVEWPHASNGAINIKGTTATTIGPWSNPSAYFRTNDGYIGIGTQTPSSKFHINTGSSADRNDIMIGKFNDMDPLGRSGDWPSIYADYVLRIAQRVQIFGGGAGKQYLDIRDQSGNQMIKFDAEGFSFINSGNLGIGVTSTTHKLEVNGSIKGTTLHTSTQSWSDFVFYDNYELRTLEEVEEHINEKGHLPEIPSEAEVTEKGINLGEMNAKLLQKIEELTLYMIDMNKQMKTQAAEIENLKSENSELKEKVNSLENK